MLISGTTLACAAAAGTGVAHAVLRADPPSAAALALGALCWFCSICCMRGSAIIRGSQRPTIIATLVAEFAETEASREACGLLRSPVGLAAAAPQPMFMANVPSKTCPIAGKPAATRKRKQEYVKTNKPQTSNGKSTEQHRK